MYLEDSLLKRLCYFENRYLTFQSKVGNWIVDFLVPFAT